MIIRIARRLTGHAIAEIKNKALRNLFNSLLNNKMTGGAKIITNQEIIDTICATDNALTPYANGLKKKKDTNVKVISTRTNEIVKESFALELTEKVIEDPI